MPKTKRATKSETEAAGKDGVTGQNKKTSEKSSKNKKRTTTPKTVLDKIVHAIRNSQAAGGPNGISRVAISKYLKSEFNHENATSFKLALKKGVSNGVLIQTGQSFRVEGDPIKVHSPEDEADRLQKEDLKVGKEGNAEAANGDTVTVKYVGTLDDGTQFDAANSFTFVLGGGEVIKGWDQGVLGMREGGKRTLVVPSKLGYGKRGSSPDIPPNATLHFVITLKSISKGDD